MKIRRKHKHGRRHIRDASSKFRARKIARMKWKGKFIPPQHYHLINPEDWWESILRLIQWKDRKICSCYMCGNPRKWWGKKPTQERKLDLHDLEDELWNC